MNLLLVGYCHLADGFLYASRSLEKLGYKIYFFPFLIYKMDNNNDLIKDYKNMIIDKKINICLWWNNSISFDELNLMINKNIKNIFFNWDPFLYNYQKYNNTNWISRIQNKEKIYPLMDNIFSCFEFEIKYFNKLPIYYNSPGFDPNISKYECNNEYICDISFILTNLYNDNNEFPKEASNLNRYDVVNKIYENRDKINFHIYGPEIFKTLYPDCYKGFIKYDDCNKVFSNSKINLSIHPIVYELNSKNSKETYFSERVPQILGSKGLLMTNSNLDNLLIKNVDYIFINENINYIDIIFNIINNNDDFNIIRNNGYEKGIKYFTWDKWALNIHNKINY